ncbi:hypothetical protein EVB94_016 [Rhizobium phage RHph_TM40]|nr:hypothetical protein EVB94_016 [Rhizobium phage RHph_TM40]QIG71850.1 hypothetical protein EVB95_016 [Rhizobium phage RHph_TM2_3B]
MNNPFSKNMMDRMFKQVDGVVWDLMSGSKIGIKTKEGIATVDLNLEDETAAVAPVKTTTRRKAGAEPVAPLAIPTPSPIMEAPDAQVSINLFDDFGMALPAFAQSTPVEAIGLGDMIWNSAQNRVMGWVVKVSPNRKSFKVLKTDGMRSEWSPPKVNVLGFETGTMVVRSLINMLPGGATGQNGLEGMQSSLGQMLMMSSMMGGSEGDSENMLKDIMPMMLMSQMGIGGAQGGMGQMMQTMMMMKMMGGMNRGSGGTKRSFFDN